MKKNIVFGTDGIRGRAEEHPFTQEALYQIGGAIGHWAARKYKRFHPRILIAADPRSSGTRIKQQLITGLLTQPLDIIDGFIMPTPAVAQLISQDNSFDLGIVISASHNSYKDNGIKFFDFSTCKLLPEDERELIDCINSYTLQEGSSSIGKQSFWKEARQCYADNFNQYFKKDFLSGISIALDCANGATSGIAKPIFEHFGAQVVALADTPDGKNINDGCGTLHPEFLRNYISQNSIDIGFSFDGDGDRIICINRDGVVKDGDDILYLLTQHSKYKHSQEVVGTVMSNSGFEDLLKEEGKQFIRTAVGDKHIFAVLKQKSLPIGGEVSGHLIARDYLGTGDSIFIALRVLESLIQNNNWDVKTFNKKPQVLLNIPIVQRDDLAKECYQEIISTYDKKLKNGRSLIRFSGTEDVLRVMIEDVEQDHAHKIAQELAAALATALSNQSEINRSL